MPTCRIDHITVTAPSLAAGSDFVFACLGVRPQVGGQHPRMGTHNLLLRLGDASFLEVIAIDPNAAPPARPRWFELDQLSSAGAPRLACWVASTTDIHTSLHTSGHDLGAVEPMTRGHLEWQITIPSDGSLPLQGVAPALIQWRAAEHPAIGLQDVGCSLVALELFHPDAETLSQLLARFALHEPVVQVSVGRAASPALVAHIHTPTGRRQIGEIPPQVTALPRDF